jgi:hypothetical protein
MKSLRIGRLSIYLEITPKKDPKALEKLLEMCRNRPLDPLTKLWDNEEDECWDEVPPTSQNEE